MDDLLIKYHQLGEIFDTFSMGVMLIAADRKIVALNHSAEIITGYESDLRGKYCHQMLLDPLCSGTCQYLEAVENGHGAESVDFEVIDQNNLVINYRDNRWHIEHFYFNNHVASVVKDSFTIQWTLL